MKWFKFYGQDYLTDPKIKTLNVEMRQCWIVLLCMANGEDKGGKILFVKEEDVINLTGVEFDGQTWHEAFGFLEIFESLGMITIDNENDNGTFNITLCNYNKRQGEAKTSYQRVKEFRERKKHNDNGTSLSKRNNSLQNVIKNEANDNSDNKNDNDRLDKIREDKNIKKDIKKVSLSPKVSQDKPEKHFSFLEEIPDNEMEWFTSRFKTTPQQVRSKGRHLATWCKAKGKEYKDYKQALAMAIQRDYGEKEAGSSGISISELTKDIPFSI